MTPIKDSEENESVKREREGVSAPVPSSEEPHTPVFAPQESQDFSTILHGKTVVVLGGSGFIGRHVVQALARNGCFLRIATRHPEKAYFLKPLTRMGQMESLRVDLSLPHTLPPVLEGADAVVNLVGVLYEKGRQRFEVLHHQGAACLSESAKVAGVTQMVHISALGASETSPSLYARTKAAGEKAVLTHFPEAVLLRPSVVFGPEDNFFNQFATMACRSPFLPLIGGGRTRLQPIYVTDVAQAVIHALAGKAQPGLCYELGGTEIKSFRACLELMLTVIQRRRFFVSIPFFLARPLAALLQLMPRPLLTLDQIRLLQQDNIVSNTAQTEHRTLRDLGIAPHSLGLMLPTYLERFRPRGQFSKTSSE